MNMNWTEFTSKLKQQKRTGGGTIAFVFVDDTIAVEATIDHLVTLGFDRIFAFGAVEPIQEETAGKVEWIECAFVRNEHAVKIINHAIPFLVGHWLYYCFNGEFLHFPFDETRKINDFADFANEERRPSIMCSKVDLYPRKGAVSLRTFNAKDLYFDSVGYFSQSRSDAFGQDLEGQIDLGGGLRWRMMEFFPQDGFWINRSQFFKPVVGLTLNPDFRFNNPAYEQPHARWHQCPTAAIASLRVYKFLQEQLEDDELVERLYFKGSAPYTAKARQLLDLGLIEPGQWF